MHKQIRTRLATTATNGEDVSGNMFIYMVQTFLFLQFTLKVIHGVCMYCAPKMVEKNFYCLAF